MGLLAYLWLPCYVAMNLCTTFGVTLPHWSMMVLVALVALYVVQRFVQWLWELLQRRRRSVDARLSDHVPGLREYPVEILVSEDGRALGMDRCVLWFDDGLLGFSGGATSFVISGDDVVARNSVFGRMAYEKLSRDEILLARAGLFSTVRLMPLVGLHRFAYQRALRSFLRERRLVEMPRQWPPAARYGEQPVLRRTLEGTAEELGAEAARTGASRGVLRAKG